MTTIFFKINNEKVILINSLNKNAILKLKFIKLKQQYIHNKIL